MTNPDLNRQCAERLGWHLHSTLSDGREFWRPPTMDSPRFLAFTTSHDAAHSLLDDLSEEEWTDFEFFLLTDRMAEMEANNWTAIRMFAECTPAQLVEAWLNATEGRK